MTAPQAAATAPPKTHLAIATVHATTLEQVLAGIRSANASYTDLIEVRLDALWQQAPDPELAANQLDAILDATEMPLMATLRPRRQGGGYEGPEDVRINLLAACAQAGMWVDLEADHPGAPQIAQDLRAIGPYVTSIHTGTTPDCKDAALRPLQVMMDLKGQVDKLAFPVDAFPDLLRALESAREHRARGGRPAIVPVGWGAEARVLCALAGSAATYGHAPASKPAVAGQPGLADIHAVWTRWGLTAADFEPPPSTWLAVLGTPIDHSLSSRIHNPALRAMGRTERYAAFEVPASSSALRLVLHVAPRLGLSGASVTAPHKVDAARMSQRDAVAEATGAANCLRFRDGAVQSTNTDATALRRLLAPYKGKAALVLGAGGAARAALWALQQNGIAATLASRSEAGREVATRFGASWIPWDKRATAAYDVLVQATPLRDEGVMPGPMHAKSVLVELVYAGGGTALQTKATQQGLPVIEGKTLLLEQAIDAWQHWFGVAPDRKVMQKALAEAAH